MKNMEKILFKPVWFDSFGAKSSCARVETSDVKILIDPGIAVMHPSFPASDEMKIHWFEEGYSAIKSASKNVNVIVISHYHYDHFIDFERDIYKGKIIFAKNPNEYINDSQRGRAEAFFSNLYRAFTDEPFENLLCEVETKDYVNPLNALPLATHKDFGDYCDRRQILLKQGEKWFTQRVKRWNKYKKIPQLDLRKVRVKFPEGRLFSFGETAIRFSGPLFHGIEFSRVGWVFSTVIECKGEKLIHSSDLNGPVIEDYTEWLIREDPDVIILDGPMTYMLGYTLNLINFKRTVENILRIIREAKHCRMIVYDHHLIREPRFKERMKEVYNQAEKLGKEVTTAAELVGKTPAVLLSQKL